MGQKVSRKHDQAQMRQDLVETWKDQSMDYDEAETYDIKEDVLAEYRYGIAAQHEVQHYVPPNFPVVARVSESYMTTCETTWDIIRNADTGRMKRYAKPGIVLFYDEFFYRLFQKDETMEDVFPNVKIRGEVLIKAMTFFLRLIVQANQNRELAITRCRFLGHKHRSFVGVRPHHFSTYTATLVEVIMYWLSERASPQVGEAWSHVMGFALKHILESFLCNRLDPYESYQNITIAAIREINSSIDSAAEKEAYAISNDSCSTEKASKYADAGYQRNLELKRTKFLAARGKSTGSDAGSEMSFAEMSDRSNLTNF